MDSRPLISVVDDDESVRESLPDLLREFGFEAQTFSSAEECLASEDRMIPPPAQRMMSQRAGSTVVEVNGSHAIYVLHPNAIASLIKQAALGAAATATS